MSTIHDWLDAEPFTLVLSAGFFGFYAHTGVLLALEQAGLRPRRVVGTSAGAISGGAWAAGVEAPRLAEILAELRRDDFWDPSWRRLGPRALGRLRRGGRSDDPGTNLGILRGRKFDELLATILAEAGVERIEDCPTALAVVTHELRSNRTRVQEQGPIRPAIRASAALPLLFGPVRVAGRLHADGGIGDRPGFAALDRYERALYHHLPHSSPWPRPSGFEAREREDSDTRRVIAIDDLPRVHPLALERGPAAMEQAREQLLRWLERKD